MEVLICLDEWDRVQNHNPILCHFLGKTHVVPLHKKYCNYKSLLKRIHLYLPLQLEPFRKYSNL